MNLLSENEKKENQVGASARKIRKIRHGTNHVHINMSRIFQSSSHSEKNS